MTWQDEYECMEWGHEYEDEIYCRACGAYLGTFCIHCGAEVSYGYNVGTCLCDDPDWAERALNQDDPA